MQEKAKKRHEEKRQPGMNTRSRAPKAGSSAEKVGRKKKEEERGEGEKSDRDFLGGTRAERAAVRGRNRLHYSSLALLKKAHARLFDPAGRYTVVQRYITNPHSGVALLEASLRLLSSDPDWKKKVVATFRSLELDYPSDRGEEGLQVRRVTRVAREGGTLFILLATTHSLSPLLLAGSGHGQRSVREEGSRA